MKAAGLIFDNSPHYLDHLAPFCALKNWPLILCESSLADTVKRFYTNLQIIEKEITELPEFLERKKISHLVSCSPKPLLQTALGSFFCKTLWLPHGNSDKGQLLPWFDALKEETTLLVYGQKMVDFFQKGHLSIEMIPIGAFRKTYAEKAKAFYDALGPPVQFADKQFTVLYAPTWEDREGNCSFWQALPELSSTLPTHINLLVKPHPNTLLKDAPKLESLIGRHERGNLQFLLDYPPIFPLLAHCDAYLGDRSSIGYDFLLFGRPLFFLDPHPQETRGKDLQSCGQSVTPKMFYEMLQKEDLFSKERQAMASYAFTKSPRDTILF